MTANFIRALAVKSFDIPDKKRRPDKAEFDLVTVDDYSVARLILEPGWHWSESAKPTEMTEYCEHNHIGFCVSGSLEIETSDGVRSIIHANDTYALPPGHDEWVVGTEPFVAVEFLGTASLGRPRSRGMHALI
ncbi:cupin domain-containing protein [Arthrobacter sp. ISL-48]|uniref:cupin domain-containing protein n=1 Tax=Arthrobacter sp. ISL-48 TaxID=2819110 RepID=UPI001BEBD546|nr:cupin domain-containing protein [Arthrobacter sp. ISL-48]MBT2532731.1 cupin domain-containing protein [Arthrobacter sp. ISL-48]